MSFFRFKFSRNFLLSCLCVLVASVVAFAAVVYVWDFSEAGEYELGLGYQEILGGSLNLGLMNEIQLNEEIGGRQNFPYIVDLENGNYFVTWVSFATDHDTNPTGVDNDGLGTHIAGKIVNKFGEVIVPEFQVNTVVNNFEYFPVAVLLDSGNIMVVFKDGGQGASGVVYSQDGDLITSQFFINDVHSSFSSIVDAVLLSDGNIMVTWRSDDSVVTADTSDDHIGAKIIDEAGNTVLSEFLVNDVNAISQITPQITASNGKVLIAWRQNVGDSDDVYGKIFDESGNVLVGQFLIDGSADEQYLADVVTVDEDLFLVLVNSHVNEGNASDLMGTVVAGDGSIEIEPFIINEELENSQSASVKAATVFDNGEVLVTWRSRDVNNAFTDDSDSYVAAKVIRFVDNEGNLEVEDVLAEFQVNVFTEGASADVVLESYQDDIVFVFTQSAAAFGVYAEDNEDLHIAMMSFQDDFSKYYDVFAPSSQLVDGVVYEEGLRSFDVEYGEGNEGSVNVQISNDDGATWYYYDGSDWVETTEDVDESNTITEVNENLFEFYQTYGAGVFSWKLFLLSDGLQEVIVDSVSLSENEIPVIGNGDAEVSLEVPENRETVAQFEGSDPEDDDLVFSISGGADSGLFSITSDGLLSISLDGDLGETYEVVVRSTDEFDGFTEQTVNVTVVRVPPSNGSSGGADVSNPFSSGSDSGSDELDEDVEDESEGGILTRLKTVTEKGEYCVLDFQSRLMDLVGGLSRLDAVKLLIDFMCVDVTDSNYIKNFTDTKELPELDRMYLSKAHELRLIQGYLDGSFRPDNILNYAELSALLYRSYEMDILESIPWYVDYIRVVGLFDEEKLEADVSVSEFVEKVEAFFGF